MPIYKNPGIIEFDGVIKRTDGGGAFVDFPYSVQDLYGVKGRVPMKATFDGIPYRGSMVKMGGDCHMVLILKEIREKLGKDRGETVHVTIELDDAPRELDMPADMLAVLKAHPQIDKLFNALAFTHRREYVQWITGAKRPETRERRLAQMLEMVAAKKNLS